MRSRAKNANTFILTYSPLTSTVEFLPVDLVNNITKLLEDRESLLKKVHVRASSMNPRSLKRAVQEYGRLQAKKLFMQFL